MYKVSSIKLIAIISSEIMDAKSNGMTYSEAERKKKCQLRILYPAKLSFTNEGEMKIFPDKQKPRE